MRIGPTQKAILRELSLSAMNTLALAKALDKPYATTYSAVDGCLNADLVESFNSPGIRGKAFRLTLRGRNVVAQLPSPVAVTTPPCEVVPAPVEAVPTPATTPIPNSSPALVTPSAARALDDAIDNLVTALVARVTGGIEDKIAARIAESIAQAAAKLSTPKPSNTKQKLPRVLVAGMKKDLHQLVRNEFGTAFDLTFVTTDEHESVWKSRGVSAEHTFVLVDFVGHKHTETLSAALVKWRPLHGAISSVRDALTALYVEKAA